MLDLILCVDDDPITLMLCKMVIAKSSFASEIITAQNGEEALNYFDDLEGKYFHFELRAYNFFQSYVVQFDEVYNASVTEFEEILSKAKQDVVDAEEKSYQEEKQRLESEKQAVIAKKKADAENKARVKRLAKDKENVGHCIKMIGVSFPLQQIENKETIDFINIVELKVEQLKADLLTQLNDL